jgi:hypothetical protein
MGGKNRKGRPAQGGQLGRVTPRQTSGFMASPRVNPERDVAEDRGFREVDLTQYMTDPESLLRRAVERRREAEADIAIHVAACRASGASWRLIGRLLGVSHVAAMKRFR